MSESGVPTHRPRQDNRRTLGRVPSGALIAPGAEKLVQDAQFERVLQLDHELVESIDRHEPAAASCYQIENVLPGPSSTPEIAPVHALREVEMFICQYLHQATVIAAVSDHHRHMLAEQFPEGTGEAGRKSLQLLGC